MFPQRPEEALRCIYCVASDHARSTSKLCKHSAGQPEHRFGDNKVLSWLQQTAAEAGKDTDTEVSMHDADVANLERWSRSLVDAINARDSSDPVLKLASPDFEAGMIDVFPPSHTPAEHVATFRKMAEESPEYHMHLDEVWADRDAAGEFASVYLTIRATGRPPGLTRESLGVLSWRKKEEGWRLVSHESMRTFVV